jgi:diaminohydroxyphosphoribosylaminopyrimidine deaminase/5-amino-6-(5-phosphoribosylamino)uracil reductase
VTLEPCSHHGKTGPCSTALISAGVAQVVSAVEDPDPRVAGRGHEILKEAGVAVRTGVLAAEARRVHAGHFRRVTEGRPHVLLKLAISADGAIGRRGERAVAVTGPLSRALVHALRAENDAILIGVGTALADDPELTCRLPGMERRSPVRVVLDGMARLPLNSRLVATAGRVPLWVAVAPMASPQRVAALEASGAVILVAELGPDGRLDAADVLHQLAMRGITRVMAEGGAALAESLVADDLVDEAMLFLSPTVLGGDGIPVFGGRAGEVFLGNPALKPIGGRRVGDDRLVHFWRREKV